MTGTKKKKRSKQNKMKTKKRCDWWNRWIEKKDSLMICTNVWSVETLSMKKKRKRKKKTLWVLKKSWKWFAIWFNTEYNEIFNKLLGGYYLLLFCTRKRFLNKARRDAQGKRIRKMERMTWQNIGSQIQEHDHFVITNE